MKKIKKGFLFFMMLCLISTFCFTNVRAESNILYSDENITIEKNINEIVIIDHTNGDQITKGIVNDEKSEVLIYLPTGIKQVATLGVNGSIYIDGELAVERIVSYPKISSRAVPSGYIHFNTYRTTQNTNKTYAGIVASLLGLIPGLGIASSLAGVIIGLNAFTDDVYIEIKQYYQNYTYYIYDVAYCYKNSNYTGLLKTVEKGPYKPI